MIRAAGFAVIAGAAVLVWFLMAPSVSGSASTALTPGVYSSLISVALADNTTNEAKASSAPQQQVTNGWVARDLLTIQAKQGDDLLTQNGQLMEAVRAQDDRIPALLVIAVIAICWHGLAVTKKLSAADERSFSPLGTPGTSSSPRSPGDPPSAASPNSPT